MAYNALPAHAANDIFALGDYDKIKGNFEAGALAAFSAKGDLFGGTGANAGTRLAVGADDSGLVADASQASGLAWQIKPAVIVYNNANISCTGGAWNLLTFNSERIDTDGCHSTVSNTSRLTVPAGGTGLYHIGACVEFDTSGAAGAEHAGLYLRLNGATIIARVFTPSNMGGSGYDAGYAVSRDYPLTAGDYVEVLAFTQSTINALYSGNYSPEFWMHYFRRQ